MYTRLENAARSRLARSTIGSGRGGYAIADGAYLRYMGQGQARFTLCHDSRRDATRERASAVLRREILTSM